ncbi:response regulator [Duganella aceris]|uniref:Response regulator transcription factor n=1 Tax=Duganella aceris TaxID=2703883 RepID=A0ABX0FS41_9BURK|nr:response regulator transcription factor [Duganella aceris]NGZ87314.1 response regulator transcription factor [Duganella aceris]
MDAITILIADDHPLIVAGLHSLIDATPDFALAGHAATGPEAIELYQRLRPSVVIIDLGGIDAIERMRRFDPDAAIVILTNHTSEEDICRGLQAGAKGYLPKDCRFEQLTACIRAVAQGRQYLPPEVARKFAERQQAARLSKREMEILVHLATGKSNKLIARSADIEVGTVKFHVNNILSKLNVASRTEAATVAARRGLLGAF